MEAKYCLSLIVLMLNELQMVETNNWFHNTEIQYSKSAGTTPFEKHIVCIKPKSKRLLLNTMYLFLYT